MHLRLTIHLPIPSPHTIAFDSSHKHLTTHSISWHRPLSSIVALLEHASMRAARYLLVLMIALEAPQLSRGRLVGPGCCRTTGGGLRAWDEPSTAEAIAAKRVHDLPMSRSACAAQCAALKGCTHFELNMYDQPVHSNEGVCSVFASGGFSVTAGCKDGSDRPRMHCFTARTNRTSTPHRDHMPARNKAASCAVCVVGQLARLELESKARHSQKPFRSSYAPSQTFIHCA